MLIESRLHRKLHWNVCNIYVCYILIWNNNNIIAKYMIDKILIYILTVFFKINIITYIIITDLTASSQRATFSPSVHRYRWVKTVGPNLYEGRLARAYPGASTIQF